MRLFQAQRRLSAYRWPLSHALMVHSKRLAQHARDGDLVLFLGAGVSMGCGLPNWDGLLNALATQVGIGPEVPAEIEDALARAKLRIAAIEGNILSTNFYFSLAFKHFYYLIVSIRVALQLQAVVVAALVIGLPINCK